MRHVGGMGLLGGMREGRLRLLFGVWVVKRRGGRVCWLRLLVGVLLLLLQGGGGGAAGWRLRRQLLLLLLLRMRLRVGTGAARWLLLLLLLLLHGLRRQVAIVAIHRVRGRERRHNQTEPARDESYERQAAAGPTSSAFRVAALQHGDDACEAQETEVGCL